jgi:hypothetical protein
MNSLEAINASVTFQTSLLSSKEVWNLAVISSNPTMTTRTRNGGNGRPSFSARKKAFTEPESSDTEEDEEVENKSMKT